MDWFCNDLHSITACVQGGVLARASHVDSPRSCVRGEIWGWAKLTETDNPGIVVTLVGLRYFSLCNVLVVMAPWRCDGAQSPEVEHLLLIKTTKNQNIVPPQHMFIKRS